MLNDYSTTACPLMESCLIRDQNKTPHVRSVCLECLTEELQPDITKKTSITFFIKFVKVANQTRQCLPH